MKTQSAQIVKATRTFACPPPLAREHGRKRASITITAESSSCAGQAPYFSVTAGIYSPGHKAHPFCMGCLHDEAARLWPAIKPIIDLHLSTTADGVPMHAIANGWYWMAGALGGAGEVHHGGSGSSGKDAVECLKIFASHVRVPVEQAATLRDALEALPDNSERKQACEAWINDQRPRWADEAAAGMALLQKLAAA